MADRRADCDTTVKEKNVSGGSFNWRRRFKPGFSRDEKKVNSRDDVHDVTGYIRLTQRSRPSGRRDPGQRSAEEEPAWEEPGAAVADERQSSEAADAGEQGPAGQGRR